MTPPTKADRAALRELLAKAGEGAARYSIPVLHNLIGAIPMLLDALDAAEEERDRLREALESVRDALRGVRATDAGGITGDPYVDGISALRAELLSAERSLTGAMDDRLDISQAARCKMVETVRDDIRTALRGPTGGGDGGAR